MKSTVVMRTFKSLLGSDLSDLTIHAGFSCSRKYLKSKKNNTIVGLTENNKSLLQYLSAVKTLEPRHNKSVQPVNGMICAVCLSPCKQR